MRALLKCKGETREAHGGSALGFSVAFPQPHGSEQAGDRAVALHSAGCWVLGGLELSFPAMLRLALDGLQMESDASQEDK